MFDNNKRMPILANVAGTLRTFVFACCEACNSIRVFLDTTGGKRFYRHARSKLSHSAQPCHLTNNASSSFPLDLRAPPPTAASIQRRDIQKVKNLVAKASVVSHCLIIDP